MIVLRKIGNDLLNAEDLFEVNLPSIPKVKKLLVEAIESSEKHIFCLESRDDSTKALTFWIEDNIIAVDIFTIQESYAGNTLKSFEKIAEESEITTLIELYLTKDISITIDYCKTASD